MAPEVDIDAYFRRTGHEAGSAPTVDTLRAIIVRHTESIPFENLDPLLGRPVLLDAPALERKLLGEGRGGYCFEHNLLLAHVLKGLGFPVLELAARVVWNAPEGLVRPRTHMLLRVEVAGEPYLADVGFGGQTPTGPLRLEPDITQETPHEPFRLVRSGEDFLLESSIRGAWTPLYRFDMQPQHLVDYEVANWFVSTHPSSTFVNNLLAGRSEPDRRYALWNNELAVHDRNGGTERRVLASRAELRAALEGPFRLTLPEDPRLDATLERLTAPAITTPARATGPTGGPSG